MITVGDIRRARVLIVDDLPANVLLLERMLHGAGYQCVTSTSDPEQVGRLHRENLYDLILLDLEMPRMDGFQVMEGLKKIEKDPRFTLECRGQMQIKGKGEMTTWLVKGPPRGNPAKAR